MVGKAWLSGHGALQLGIPHLWEDQETEHGYAGAFFPFLFSLGSQLMGQCCPHSECVSPSLFNLLENTVRHTHQCVS